MVESKVQTNTAKRTNITLKKGVSKHTVKTEEVFCYRFSIYNSNEIDVTDTTFTVILDKGKSVVNMPQGMTATSQEDGITVLSMDTVICRYRQLIQYHLILSRLM